ncbi:hypothetical protein N658DRAFT_205109 [Parathielavia hyrcaniae]|uniref:Uncharacterized protein n=1 Tax=Parathielavia hyrcaniae TaxID=113614 RepID=A0AAN6SZV1_9PEZI|nr:hypothetical protein N658DRAFT_205109 [Parathielavia hyrcaniae]
MCHIYRRLVDLWGNHRWNCLSCDGYGRDGMEMGNGEGIFCVEGILECLDGCNLPTLCPAGRAIYLTHLLNVLSFCLFFSVFVLLVLMLIPVYEPCTYERVFMIAYCCLVCSPVRGGSVAGVSWGMPRSSTRAAKQIVGFLQRCCFLVVMFVVVAAVLYWVVGESSACRQALQDW